MNNIRFFIWDILISIDNWLKDRGKLSKVQGLVLFHVLIVLFITLTGLIIKFPMICVPAYIVSLLLLYILTKWLKL